MRPFRFATVAVALAFVLATATCAQASADAENGASLTAQEQANIASSAWRQKVEAQAQSDVNALPEMPAVAPGSLKTYYMYAEVAPWQVAPGVTQQAWTYDGTVPGPTIHVRQGDRVRVILINRLPEPTTIHWHGLEVDPNMDGVPGMSQDAVAPNQSFVYEFTATSPGTYIYHTHFDDLNQLDRGLYGAVVVDPKQPTERFDRDYLMLLSSWRVLSGAENYFSINGKSYPLTKPFLVRSGQHVRIREINISGTEFHTMHLHGHRFQVIAVDGQPVAAANRQTMVTLTIGPGETRDIAFVANAKPGTWMFHCHVLDHMMNGAVGPGGLITAVQYENAPARLVSMASQDTMTAASGPGGDEGGAGGGPPMAPLAVYLLGAIAGLTIFFGLPFAALRGVSRRGIAFLNSIAIGILFFLLFDILRQASDPVETALRNVALGAPRFQFWGLLAVYLSGLGVGLLSLVFFSRSVLTKEAPGAGNPLALATMIAAGIGLHNFSEGLAIGQSAASGAIQLALLLIIGFGLHNMTEGFGIAAPLAASGGGAPWRTVVMLGLIGGGPTFLGTIVGYRFVSPVLSVLFLTLAAGAIIYVISEMTKAGARIGFKELATVGVFVGFAAGLGTDLILSAAGA